MTPIYKEKQTKIATTMQKIMFNDKYGLTDAVIEGTKTMTRRVVPEREVEKYQEWYDDVLSIGFDDLSVEIQSFEDVVRNIARYSVSEIVAVAQSYQNIPVDCLPHGVFSMEAYAEQKGWSNKMFVEAKLMSHQIRITDITVERLQDISNEDCLKEGVYKDEDSGRIIGYPFGIPFFYTFFGAKNKDGKQLHWTTPCEAFAALIDKVSGKGTWEKNPWVFAYEFELIK